MPPLKPPLLPRSRKFFLPVAAVAVVIAGAALVTRWAGTGEASAIPDPARASAAPVVPGSAGSTGSTGSTGSAGSAGSTDGRAGERPALTVAVTTPRQDALPIRVAANGNIVAWQEASIGSEANGLRLVEVHVNVGDTVRRGQLLASFAPETVQAELAQRQAAVIEAEVALTDAAATAARGRALLDSGAMSRQQVQQQIAAERGAQARLDAARAQVTAQALRLAQTRIVAPDDGVISARAATVGSVVPNGQELFRLIRRGRLEWRAEVASSDLAALKPGQPVRITLVDGSAVEGRVRMLSPQVDTQTRNGLVYVDVLSNGGARAGMYARGEFDLGRDWAMTLPRAAVQLREGFHQVMRVGVDASAGVGAHVDARVRETRVTVGRQSGERIEILDGLRRTDRVVASGGAFLGDNDLVRIVEDVAP